MRLECGCPSVYPQAWHGKDINLGACLVHSLSIPMFFHMPIAYEAYLFKQHRDIEQLGLHPKWPGFVMTQSAMFRGKILCPLQEEHSPARAVHRLPNPYWLRARLVEGDVGSIRDVVKSMQSDLIAEGLMPKELYLCYLTCPRCAPERGGSKIMILRRWVRSKRLSKRLALNVASEKNGAPQPRPPS